MAMAGAGTGPSPRPIHQPSPRVAATPLSASTATSPPSKRELASWWKKFRKTTEKGDEKVDAAPGIFGVPLSESIRYANVAISLTKEDGESFIYGYVPIVVAKCGVFLKERATDVEGIFRLSGSAKRIKDLQAIFNSPDRYGKGLDWTGYTVHDAANILRRYLNQLPEPIVPLEYYEKFRDPLRHFQTKATTDGEAHPMDMSVQDESVAVHQYQKLITELPPLNRQLLLYILDLLAVFASKSDLNRMDAANLAAIFQPGIISHPSHDMSPMEYRLSQYVLIFLIENQDNFLIGMNGTAVDEKTQKDVESGAPSIRSPKSNVARSTSNASAGADSLRKYGGLRRNVSVSSHNSRDRSSPGVSSPGTPSGTAAFPTGSGASGIARSNTVPSKRSPAIGSNRFQRMADSSGANSPSVTTPVPVPESPIAHPDSADQGMFAPEIDHHPRPEEHPEIQHRPRPEPISEGPSGEQGVPPQSTQQSVPQTKAVQQSQETSAPTLAVQTAEPPQPGTKDRKISNIFAKSPLFGPSDPQQRQPKKLQKRQRLPGSSNDSAQSSTNSLQGDDQFTFHTPMLSPELNAASRGDPMNIALPAATNTVPSPLNETPTKAQRVTPPTSNERQAPVAGLKPPKSPDPSLHSRSSITDNSEFEPLEDHGSNVEKMDKKRNRWRFSSSVKKGEEFPLQPPPPIGQNPAARGSNSSLGSSTRPRKSFTGESQRTQPDLASTGAQSYLGYSSHESSEPLREGSGADGERRGFFGKFKQKITESKLQREAEKERAKSPPRAGAEQSASRNSLSAFAQEHLAQRGRSFDRPREETLSSVAEKPQAEGHHATTIAPAPSSTMPGAEKAGS